MSSLIIDSETRSRDASTSSYKHAERRRRNTRAQFAENQRRVGIDKARVIGAIRVRLSRNINEEEGARYRVTVRKQYT